jgi:hypothetical protein
MMGGYLGGAKNIAREGSTVVIAFEAGQDFVTNYLSDTEQIALMKKIASEIAGEPLEVRIQSEAAAPAEGKRDKKGAVVDDPIIKAFSKHLGGEVVQGRGNKRTEGQ